MVRNQMLRNGSIYKILLILKEQKSEICFHKKIISNTEKL